MIYSTLAELVIVIHLAFILFAVLGGLLVLRHKGYALLHLPACLWAALVELAGWLCPLTPLENWLRAQGGGLPYRSGFIERYLLPLIYPSSLTRRLQLLLGFLVLALNLGIYGVVWWRWRRARGKAD